MSSEDWAAHGYPPPPWPTPDTGHLAQSMLCRAPAQGISRYWIDRWLAAWLCRPQTPGAFPCRVCPSCRLYASGEHPDLLRQGPESGKSLGIDAVRQGLEFLAYAPQVALRRIWLLWDANALTVAAANALLKVLEEPAPRAHVLLLAAEPSRLLPTIRSRCQRLAAPAMEVSHAAQWLRTQGVPATASVPLARQFAEAPDAGLAAWQGGWQDARDAVGEWLRCGDTWSTERRLQAADAWTKDSETLGRYRHQVLSILADRLRLDQNVSRIKDDDAYRGLLTAVARQRPQSWATAQFREWLLLERAMHQNLQIKWRVQQLLGSEIGG